MSLQNIDFSEAMLLKNIYGKKVLEKYDYKNSTNKSLFSIVTLYFKIIDVKKVNNPQLYGMYLFRKEEAKKIYGCNVVEKYLYHVTNSKNIKSITEHNLDWRMTYRSRYGMGVCFSQRPEYADQHSSSKGVIIICKVLMNKVQKVGVSYDLKIPDIQYDTTLSNGGVVYVKYDDYSFYPEFVVKYQ